jgi:SAM-dependent methyltransferase
LVYPDPVIAKQDRIWFSAHNHEHDLLDGWFRRNAPRMLAEMDAADIAGPGRLELDPTLAIPEYAKHEIHQQPGGYVGNAFAGHIYHYATNMFYRGTNNQDERHLGYAAGCPLPRDDQVRRILDLGCGIGQLTVAMKERPPAAEVIGLDLAAPMLRYGHMRVSELGSDVTFTQRLAEDTHYPDGHFDVVISYIMFHEVTADASRKIIAEAFRVLRSGGQVLRVEVADRVGGTLQYSSGPMSAGGTRFQESRDQSSIQAIRGQTSVHASSPELALRPLHLLVRESVVGRAYEGKEVRELTTALVDAGVQCGVKGKGGRIEVEEIISRR